MDRLNKIIEKYPVELKLLLVFCGSERWEVAELLPVVDWDKFMAWVKRHRVTPAVYRYIKNNPAVIPENIVSKIETLQKNISRKSLLLTSELIKTGHLLDKNNIPWYTVKGPFLAQLLYGNIEDRDYRDIDIIINSEKTERTIELLSNNGFSALVKLNIQSLLKINHNIELKNEINKAKAELHWRLFASKNLSSIFNFERIKMSKAEIQGYEINTPDLFFHCNYILLHSAIHQWSEIQWLTDCREIIKNTDPALTREFFKRNNLLQVFEVFQILNNALFFKSRNAKSEFDIMATHCLKAISVERKTVWSKIQKTTYLALLSDDPEYKKELISLRIKRMINNPAKRLS